MNKAVMCPKHERREEMKLTAKEAELQNKIRLCLIELAGRLAAIQMRPLTFSTDCSSQVSACANKIFRLVKREMSK